MFSTMELSDNEIGNTFMDQQPINGEIDQCYELNGIDPLFHYDEYTRVSKHIRSNNVSKNQ